jgi:hypothetical protein
MFNSQWKAAGANSTNTSNWRYWRWMVIHVTGVHYKQKTTVVYNKLIYRDFDNDYFTIIQLLKLKIPWKSLVKKYRITV